MKIDKIDISSSGWRCLRRVFPSLFEGSMFSTGLLWQLFCPFFKVTLPNIDCIC